MNKDLFEKIGRTLYGNQWKTDLASDLGVTSRYINYLVNEKRAITKEIDTKLKKIILRKTRELNSLNKKI